MSYKETLNLPRTDFSMKANLNSLEPKILKIWEGLDIYNSLRKEREGKGKFILHDGPPYANGLIHIGHALNKILKDIIVKYKFMQGHDCPFTVGWDCHGLPVEHQLFKELNLSKHDVEVTDFRKKAKDFALKFVDLQTEDFKRLGCFSDWARRYLTLNPDYEYAVLKLLQSLVSKGYVYRGRKPVNWCAKCETALAEAEVEYTDKDSDSIYLLFKVSDDKKIIGSDEVHFLVWTTTPWTLISNVAVAVHPRLKYCLIEHEGKKIVLAEALRGRLEQIIKSDLKAVRSFTGQQLENILLKHPFLDREAPVVLADFVSSEEGSGCVHIAPGHGAEDFSLTRKYKLPIIMPVDDRGIFSGPEPFKGKNTKAAGHKVIEVLKENGKLISHTKITHSYPHCWRCKEPIIFRATFQWFMNVDHENLRKKLIADTEKVRWVPPTGKERMKAMLELRPDWCLSRQRLWGIPIPAVRCKSCDEVVLEASIIEKVASVFKEKGSDSWFSLAIEEFLPATFKCPKCNKDSFDKEYDILDVWFESGASFLGVVKNDPDLQFPADLYLEGSDQHRGWFQVSLIPSVATEGIPPFKTILTHGFVVDGEGRKMSKSLGNVIAPQEIIKKYGAEILRLWTAYSDYSEDVKISPDIIKQLVDMYRKVRNTLRFILGNIHGFSLEDDSPGYKELSEIDRFMLSKAANLEMAVLDHYENFRFYKVLHEIFNFCNIDLSSFYLDILKDRLYTFSPKSTQRRSAQFVLSQVFEIIVRLIAPILSFTAEEAYSSYNATKNKKGSIFITAFSDISTKDWLDEDLTEQWQRIMVLRSQVLKEIENKREAGVIGSSLEASITLSLPDKDYTFFKERSDELQEVFIVSEVSITQGELKIKVDKSNNPKCPRCWNFRNDIGTDMQFNEVCGKCARALKGGQQT